MTVKQLMSANVVTIDDQASCREAVALMCRQKVRHLPVVIRHGHLSGVVTDRDLLSLAVRMTKRTSVCVASDSTNHPVWNRASQ